MFTLYDYLPSQNAWKVRLLLNHLEQPYKQEIISIFEGQGRKDWFLAISPTGAVPAIKLTNGSTIAESNAILVYLSEGSQYLPADSITRAQVLQWLFFESDYVQASVATLRHWEMTGKSRNRSADLLKMKYEASLKVLNILNCRLEDNTFLAGSDYTIADMSVFAYVHLSEDAGISLAAYANVQRWINTVRDQPRFLTTVFPYSIDGHSKNEL